MTIEEEIAAFLLADAQVSALAPAGVWEARLPQGARQGVVFEMISAPREITLDCRQKINARYQFTSYEATPPAARLLHNAVADALTLRLLHNAVADALTFFRGYLTAGGTFVETALEDERGPMFDPDLKLYRFDADIVLSY